MFRMNGISTMFLKYKFFLFPCSHQCLLTSLFSTLIRPPPRLEIYLIDQSIIIHNRLLHLVLQPSFTRSQFLFTLVTLVIIIINHTGKYRDERYTSMFAVTSIRAITCTKKYIYRYKYTQIFLLLQVYPSIIFTSYTQVYLLLQVYTSIFYNFYKISGEYF